MRLEFYRVVLVHISDVNSSIAEAEVLGYLKLMSKTFFSPCWHVI